MSPTRHALVIGGGVAGPATAIALRKAGIDSVIYEAHASGAGGVGAFLTLASNGLDALRVLGVGDAASAGFPTPRMTLRSGTGKRLGDVRTGRSDGDGLTSRTLTRADLYAVLRGEALARGIPIEHGKRLVAAEDTGAGVRALFADGTEASGDLLIGADGVHSTVRRIIDPAAPEPAFAGLLNFGGYARGVTVDAEPGAYEMIFGRRAFFGYVVAPDREVWWFANAPRRREPSRGEVAALGDDGWRRELSELFAADAGPALALVEATPQPGTIGPMHALPHLPVWRRGAMAVLGDAAHAPSPTSGQGASLAIEDGLVLAQCLRDEAAVGTALARFEAARRPRVERIARWAARMNSNKAAGPVARIVRDATLPAILRLTANAKAIRETFEFHVDWDEAAVTVAHS